jgi:hypothetical protein
VIFLLIVTFDSHKPEKGEWVVKNNT